MSTNKADTGDNTLYNIAVSLPSGVNLDDVRQRALSELGMPESKVTPLMDALRRLPSVKIGSKLTKERAETASAEFSRIGLRVEMTATLQISAIAQVEDNTSECPACDKKIVLPANRQCPECGVFVDKITEEFLMRKRLMKKERAIAQARGAMESKDLAARAREEMERRIREEIRKELEEELGLSPGKKGAFGGIFAGKKGKVRATAIVALVAGSLVAGRVSNSIPGLGSKPDPAPLAKTASNEDKSKKDIDKLMGSISSEAGVRDPSGESDSSLDDEFLMGPARSTGGGKGISVEQAVAAATALGKTAGVNISQGNPATAGRAVSPGSPATADNAAGPVEESFVLPQAVRDGLMAEFASDLAQLGQVRRGRQIIKTLLAKSEVASDAALMSRVRLTEIELKAYAVEGMSAGGARSEIDDLRSRINALPTSSERVAAFSRAAVALARARSVTGEAGAAFAGLAGEALRSGASGAERSGEMGDWSVALAEVLLSEVIDHARRGRWKPAQEAFTRLSTVLTQRSTPEAAAALAGIEFRARAAMGDDAKAIAALDAGLAGITRANSPLQQARMLRALIAHAGYPTHANAQSALTRLATAAEGSKGAERAEAFAILAILYATLGNETQSAALRQESAAGSGTSTNESKQLAAATLVRSDLALAQARHREGAHKAVETLVQRVADYLL